MRYLPEATPVVVLLEQEADGKDTAHRKLLGLISMCGLNAKAMRFEFCRACDGSWKEDEIEPALLERLVSYQAFGAKAILAVGEVVTKLLGIAGNVLKIRGSVYEWKGYYVVPTYDPWYLIRGNQAQEPTACADVEKVNRIGRAGWKPPKERFTMFPTMVELEDLFDKLERRKDKPILACDLETTSLNTFRAEIIVMGVAWSAEDAVSIPLMRQGGSNYWTNLGDIQGIRQLIQSLFDRFEMVWHNALYDLAVMHNLGYKVWGTRHDDTMLMHHAFHPELPHDLGYVGSVYADTPYWKDAVLGNEANMKNIPDEELRLYNARDCCVTWQIYERLKVDLINTGTWNIYNNISRRLIKPCIMMHVNGMKMYANRLPAWVDEVTQNVEENKVKFVSITNTPEGFNAASAMHLRWLFFGLEPKSLADKRTELAVYDSTGKNKTTKLYQGLRDTVALYDLTKPLTRARGSFGRTKSGEPELSTKSLTKMRMAAMKEVNDIDKLRRRSAEHDDRQKGLLQLVRAIDALFAYKKWAKLKSTYTKFSTELDGRIHPQYMIHGTRTGRLASRGPNWQNLPPSVKKLFGPSKGNVFVYPDFSNVELRVLSFDSGDVVLQDIFASGLKVHNENVKILFGIGPEHKDFDIAKRAAKTYIFGRNYGGGLRGIFERVSMQVPELGLTWDRFVEADENYRMAHPQYVAWSDKTLDTLAKTRTITTAYGRKRYFLGDIDAIMREGLNTPIQGTAADIFNESLIEMQDWIDANPGARAKLVGAVHDAILVECPEEHGVKVAEVLSGIMERPRALWGKQVSFPVDTDICLKSWDDTVTLKEFRDGRKCESGGTIEEAGVGGERHDWEWGLDDSEEITDQGE